MMSVLLAQMMPPVSITLDWSTITGTLLVGAIGFLGGTLWVYVRAVDKLVHIVQSKEPPGVSARLTTLENEFTAFKNKDFQDVRDWALKNGFDRRRPSPREGVHGDA